MKVDSEWKSDVAGIVGGVVGTAAAVYVGVNFGPRIITAFVYLRSLLAPEGTWPGFAGTWRLIWAALKWLFG